MTFHSRFLLHHLAAGPAAARVYSGAAVRVLALAVLLPAAHSAVRSQEDPRPSEAPPTAGALEASGSSETSARPASSTFFPGGTLVVPYVGHMPEPVSGLRKEIGSSRMRLTIGAPLDVWELRLADDGTARLRVGIDFFIHALTTSSEGLRLQIDAADGWFGGHVTGRWDSPSASLALRLRILHLSGHMVDGHFDGETDTWKDGREPIPFTRDFGELSAAVSTSLSSLTIRGFAGASYATLIRPDNIKRWAFLGGLDLHTASLLADDGPFPLHLYGGYTLTLAGIPTYIGTNSIEAGVKFGDWNGSGIRVYAGYYAGQMMFTQYYDLKTDHWAIGFGFEL